MSAWLWLAGLAVLLVLLFGLVLSSPIELQVYAAFPAQRPVQVDVRWLYGLIDLEDVAPVGAGDDEEAQPAQPQAEPSSPEGPTEPGSEPDGDEETSRIEDVLDKGVGYLEMRKDVETKAKMALAVIRTEDLPLAVTRLLRDLVAAVHVERIGIQAGFGFGSPAETGKVFGQLKAAFAWTHATDRIHVDLQPDFHAIGFEAGADAQIEARTWSLLRPLIVFALAPPTWQAVKNARGARDG